MQLIGNFPITLVLCLAWKCYIPLKRSSAFLKLLKEEKDSCVSMMKEYSLTQMCVKVRVMISMVQITL